MDFVLLFILAVVFAGNPSGVYIHHFEAGRIQSEFPKIGVTP
jgi:hypothetical protein